MKTLDQRIAELNPEAKNSPYAEGLTNGYLAMDHPDFGFSPYRIGSKDNLRWNAGFQFAFDGFTCDIN